MHVEGGVIGVGPDGKPNGLFIDNAMQLVSKYIPEPKEEELLARLQKAQDSLFSVGLTSIVDAGLSTEQLEDLKKFYQKK